MSAKRKDCVWQAALAEGFRFIADTRSTDKHRNQIVKRGRESDGVPACEKVFACNVVCPKGVMLGTAIASIRKLRNQNAG